MKIILSKKLSERGTTLLVSLCLCMILSVTIAGYLKHGHQQHCMSMRSQSWNTSIAVTEAGIEEALQHLNANFNSLASQGWTQSGSTYTRSRVLMSDANGNPIASYTVQISAPSLAAPVITARAFITDKSFGSGSAPMSDPATGSPVLAIINGGITTTDPKTQTTPAINTLVSRAVRVTATRNGMFLKSMVAKHKIDMNGNNVMTDSFNSTLAAYSNNGRYPVGMPWKTLSNGDIASNDTIVNTVDIGNADIYGHVAVGPGGTVNVGVQGGIGTRSWVDSNPGQTQPGYFSDDMNFTFPEIDVPYTSGLSPQADYTVSTTNYMIYGWTNSMTTSYYPSPAPASGVTTNSTETTTSTPPSPVPYGTVTNVVTVKVQSSVYPSAGTYSGTVELKGSKYHYSLIVSRSYTYPTYTYTYQAYDFSTSTNITSQTYDYLFQGSAPNMPPVNYYVDEINSESILIKGNVRLVVGGDFSLGGNGSKSQLVVDTDGSLEMFVDGTTCDLSGNGVVNKNGFAQNLIVWCDESVTSLTLNGNGEFTGVIVAPEADVKLNGGGNSANDFIGSLIAKSVTLNGHFSFHYDEALSNIQNGGRYKISQWNEVPATSTGLTFAIDKVE